VTLAETREYRQETTLRDFLNVVFRRKWIIVSILGLTTFLVFFLNARRPLLYESVSRILVARGEQTNVLTGQVRYLGWAEEVASQIQVILSEGVFARAQEIFADSARSRDYPSAWQFNPGAVRADVIGESNVFVIRYANVEPEVCPLGCEAVTLAFEEYYRERRTPPQLTDFFASELAGVRAELEDWRSRRQRFLNESKFFGADETSKFYLAKITSVETDLSSLNGEISSQEIRVANLRTLSEKSGPELERELAFSMSRHVLQTTIVQNIKQSLQSFNVRMEELQQRYTEKHPEVIATRSQIAELHADLERQVVNAYRMEAVVLEEMAARRALLERERRDARAQLEAVPEKARALTQFDEMISTLAKQHEILISRQSESEIAKASSAEWEVTILAHASPPVSKKTSDYVRLLLGPLLALVVALGIAFFLESLDHSLRSSAEAEEFLATAVLATISEVHEKRKSA
jgi:uncharacterized protein involved in exopolysaccharide biosynthesis